MNKYLLLIIFTLGSSALWAQEKVLISYFKPFGGSDVNHTEIIAKKLRKLKLMEDHGIEVVLCPINSKNGLDVSFYSKRDDIITNRGASTKLSGSTSSFEQLRNCMLKHPEITSVYSLGEGLCHIQYENFAYNEMSTGLSEVMRDHNGNMIPYSHKIEQTGSEYKALNGIKNIEAFCRAKLQDSRFTLLSKLSVDPGDYVCNNLSYWTEKYIEKENPKLNFEFIHVPLQNDEYIKHCSENTINNIETSQKPVEETNDKFSDFIANQVATFIKTKTDLLKNNLATKISYQKNCFMNPLTKTEMYQLFSDVDDILANDAKLQECIRENQKELDQKRNEKIKKMSRLL